MYGPVPPRPKKTSIIPSRNGCKSCRERRTKCDKQKPSCGTCIRLGNPCEPVRRELNFRTIAGPASKDSYAQTELEASRIIEREERSQASVCDVRTPDLDIVNSLKHTERDVFYSTYWEDASSEHPISKDAILALSSCNLSRIRPDHPGSSRLHMASFRPNLAHQTRSQLYYSSAIRKFISLNESDFRSHARIVFTCHVQGLASFLMELRGTMKDAVLRALLSAWRQVRFVAWWAHAYFSTVEIHRGLPSVRLLVLLAESFDTMQERHIAVLSIMCESHRLNSREVLSHWSPVTEDKELDFKNHQEDIGDTREIPLAQMAAQTNKLDEWLLRLPPSEQPLATNADHSDSSQRKALTSHDAALNFAYYVVARIMQCTSLLYLSEPTFSEEAWVHFLLRIAKGTNIIDSFSKNNYTIGFPGLMLAAMPQPRLQPTEEGAFPVYQTLGIVKAINQQRMVGREIFGVTLPEDDAGGIPKFTAYNSQSISTLLFHGR
ncbi:hypothetical protein BDW62DRAFT_213369 [Aspergillus aurantiobrunneus]